MAAALTIYLLAAARCYGFFTMLPQFGELEAPAGVKITIVICITPFLAAHSVYYPEAHLGASILMLLIKELLLGMFIGFLVGLPLRLPQLIGDVIDNQRGTAVTSQYNPSSGEDSSVLGQLLMMSMTTYFFTSGGFDRFIGILSGTFAIQSVTSFDFNFGPNFVVVANAIISNYLHLFAILALPVMLVMLIADVALGVSSRFAQSLNVFSLSQSIKAVVAIAMLISLHPKMQAAYLSFFDEVERSLL